MIENYLTFIGISINSIGISVNSVGISASPAGIYVSPIGISVSSVEISARQSLYVDILVLVQETPFTDLRCKEINRLLKKGVFTVIMEKDVL